MMQLDNIEVTGKTATLCFMNEFSQKKIYKNMTIIEHSGEMILFSKDGRSYLFDGENIQDAEEITLHDKFKRCYTLKDQEHFILFCGGKQSFEISGADIKGIIPINGDRFIVEYTHELHVYKDKEEYAVFTKTQKNKRGLRWIRRDVSGVAQSLKSGLGIGYVVGLVERCYTIWFPKIYFLKKMGSS